WLDLGLPGGFVEKEAGRFPGVAVGLCVHGRWFLLRFPGCVAARDIERAGLVIKDRRLNNFPTSLRSFGNPPDRPVVNTEVIESAILSIATGRRIDRPIFVRFSFGLFRCPDRG